MHYASLSQGMESVPCIFLGIMWHRGLLTRYWRREMAKKGIIECHRENNFRKQLPETLGLQERVWKCGNLQELDSDLHSGHYRAGACAVEAQEETMELDWRPRRWLNQPTGEDAPYWAQWGLFSKRQICQSAIARWKGTAGWLIGWQGNRKTDQHRLSTTTFWHSWNHLAKGKCGLQGTKLSMPDRSKNGLDISWHFLSSPRKDLKWRVNSLITGTKVLYMLLSEMQDYTLLNWWFDIHSVRFYLVEDIISIVKCWPNKTSLKSGP